MRYGKKSSTPMVRLTLLIGTQLQASYAIMKINGTNLKMHG